MGYFAAYGDPEVQAALGALMDAGNEIGRWMTAVKACDDEALAAGFPSMRGGSARAPFDEIGDTMRGTQGIVMDMFRQPDKLIEAMERLTPLIIADGVAGQRRTIYLITDGTDDLEVTPTNFKNGTKVTLDTAGESVTLEFDGTNWFIISHYGGTVS